MTFNVFLIHNFGVMHVAGLTPSFNWERSGPLVVLSAISFHLTHVQVHFLLAYRFPLVVPCVHPLHHGAVFLFIITPHYSESPQREVHHVLAGVGFLLDINIFGHVGHTSCHQERWDCDFFYF